MRCLLGEWDARHVALLVPRRVVDLAGAWSTGLPVSADWDFVLRALEHATVVGTTEPVVLYRRHGASVSGRADLESGERVRETIIERFLARNPELRGSGVERRARAAAATDRALAYAAAGLYVGPLKHRSKHPGSRLGSAWQYQTSRDLAVIPHWFPDGTNRGVFLHCGRSGLVVLDGDKPENLHPLLC